MSQDHLYEPGRDLHPLTRTAEMLDAVPTWLRRDLRDSGWAEALSRIALGTAWIAAVVWVVGQAAIFAKTGSWGFDAHAYWIAGRRSNPYEIAFWKPDAFFYSPVFAVAMRAVAWVPWPVFVTSWMVAESACFVWLVRPLQVRWAVPVLMFCSLEVMFGNIYGFMAVTIVLGVRQGAWWGFGLLTKIVPGVVGIAWMGVHRDWRGLARLGTVVFLVCLVSWLVQPSLWTEWLTFLRHNTGSSQPGIARLAGGAILCAMSARRWWLLPVGVALLTPVFVALSPLTLLAAIPRLVVAQHRVARPVQHLEDAVGRRHAARRPRARVPVLSTRNSAP
jgi:hypothetical protein